MAIPPVGTLPKRLLGAENVSMMRRIAQERHLWHHARLYFADTRDTLCIEE
jgi:hypothetical protein